MKKQRVSSRLGVVGCALAILAVPAASFAGSNTDQEGAWSEFFWHRVVHGVPHPNAAGFEFNGVEWSRPGYLPTATDLFVLDAIYSGRSPDSDGVVGLVQSKAIGTDRETELVSEQPVIEPIDECAVVVAQIVQAAEARLAADGVSTRTSSEAFRRHLVAATAGELGTTTFTPAERIEAINGHLVTHGLTVRSVKATAEPAAIAPATRQSERLAMELDRIAHGIFAHGLDRQPDPVAMVRGGEWYENITRDIVADELDGAPVHVSGWAAVFGDSVRLVTVVQYGGGAFVVDGSDGSVSGPYSAGVSVYQTIADAMIGASQMRPGDPLLIFAAN